MKVLIADDDKLTREGIIENVDWDNMGLSLVPSANNGKVALERITEYDIDILITDIRMPFLSGFELIAAANQKGCFPATIIISGYDDYEYLQQAIKLHIILGYIFKPISLDRLNASLKEAIDFRKEWKASTQIPKITDKDTVRYSYKNYIIEVHSLEDIHKYLVANDVAKAKEVFSQYWDEFYKKKLSLNFIKRYCLELVISLLQLTAKTGGNFDTFFYDSDPLSEISALTEKEHIFKYVTSTIEKVHLCLTENQNITNPYVDYVSQAILTRHSDPALSLTTIATELGRNAQLS